MAPESGYEKFAKYFAVLWGVAGFASAIAPMLKVLDPVVPLFRVAHTTMEYGPGFMRIPTGAIRAAGVLVSIIVLAVTAAEGKAIQRRDHELVRRRAVLTFLTGFAVLFFYWVLSQNVPHLAMPGFQGAAAEGGIALLYVGFYLCMTRGFVMLAMNDFVDTARERDAKAKERAQPTSARPLEPGQPRG